MASQIKRNRQPGDPPPAKEGKTTPYPCIVCSENVQDGGIECDWCVQWEHAECAELNEDELKVLCTINSCVKFFCKVCQPVAFKFFDDIKEKQNSIATKVNVIEENLSKSVADLNSRLEQLNKQLNDHPTATQSIPSQSKGAPMLTETAQTSQLPANKHEVVSDNSADRKFNVVVYGQCWGNGVAIVTCYVIYYFLSNEVIQRVTWVVTSNL